jgi:hypothetical protein
MKLRAAAIQLKDRADAQSHKYAGERVAVYKRYAEPANTGVMLKAYVIWRFFKEARSYIAQGKCQACL